LARTKRGAALCSLHHVIDLDWMMEAYRLTRKDGASGIDGVTAADYEVNLEANLLDLLDRIKSGRYRAPPVRRAYIPKADGSQRMLGIPTFEDKVAQRAVTMVLEDIHEQGLPSLLIWLPARTVGSPSAPRSAERAVGQASLLGARYRHTQVFRFDSALPPANVPRPTSHRRRHPKDDR
jgi:hypothetical protein